MAPRKASVAKGSTTDQPAERKQISPMALSRFAPQPAPFINPFAAAPVPPGMAPKGTKLAMDDALGAVSSWAGGFAAPQGLHAGRVTAFGFPFLAELAQRPEYRRMATTLATEMTRAWIELQATGDDKANRIAAINAEMGRLHVRQCFGDCAEKDALFGGAHLYLDTGSTLDDKELLTSIGDGADGTSRQKIGDGVKLKAIRTVEPVWVYPQGYATTNPLSADWYNPSQWLVMGRQVHATRLLTMIGRPVPDMLKPAYSFRGVALSQLAFTYVENWIRTRQSVSDMLAGFSTFVLSTDLSADLSGGAGDTAFARMALFNLMRSNTSSFVVNKETEDLSNVSAPLGGLEGLQSQAQEQLSTVSGIPISILLGNTPSGLNASSEGEIRIFYDFVHAYQERLFRQPLTTIINFIQLSLFGNVDSDITFRFVPLWSMSETERATLRKTEAETAQIMIDAGVIWPAEERKRVAEDPDTLYPGLDVTDEPDLDEEEAEGLVVKGETGEDEGDDEPVNRLFGRARED